MNLFAVIPCVAVLGLSACMTAPAIPNISPGQVDTNQVPLAIGAVSDPFVAFSASVNDYRPVQNPLAYNSQLQGAAQTHANDMSTTGFFDHMGSDGSMPWDRVSDQGYIWAWVGENIAVGQTSAQQALTGWQNSPAHDAILLSSEPTEFGLANAPGNYWVMVLARPGT
ncbi:MAG: CAP domain-containing protein [Paracoccaceae bacterium]